MDSLVVLRDDDLWSMMNSSTIETKPQQMNTIFNTDKENSRLEFKLGGSCSNILSPSITQRNPSPSESFVVINSSPTEEVEIFSMANLQDVQATASSIDYNSIITNINPEEIQQKLTEVLLENSKLKETLIRNNNAMKKNFSSLVSWQENVDSILSYHKKKFSEIRDLVHQLKKENHDLKMQIANNIDDSLIFKNPSLKCDHHETVTAKIMNTGESFNDMITLSTDMSEKEKVISSTSSVEEVNNSIQNSLEEKYVFKFADTCISTPVQYFVSQIKESNNLESLPEASAMDLTTRKTVDLNSFTKSSNTDKVSNKCINKLINSTTDNDLSKKSLVAYTSNFSDGNETAILSGEKKYNEIQTKLMDLSNNFQKCNLNNQLETTCPRKNRLTSNVKKYSDQLQKIIEFYSAERTRFRVIQESLIKCEKILSEITFLDDKNLENLSMIHEGQFEIDKLRSQFLQNIIKYGDENKQLIEMQNLYQQIFWDYSSLINELEMIEEENFKLKAIEDKVKEKDAVLDNLTKEYVEKMRVLSLKDKELDEKDKNFKLNQTLLDQQLKEIEMKKKKLHESIAIFNDEIEKLKEEKKSLDRQSELYESKRMSESIENTSLQMKLKEQKEMEMRNMVKLELIIANLREQLEKKTHECESAIVAVKLQLDYYINDIEAERASKESIIQERNTLKETIARLQQETTNSSSSNGARCLNEPTLQIYCGICQRYVGAGENHGWNFCNMEFD